MSQTIIAFVQVSNVRLAAVVKIFATQFYVIHNFVEIFLDLEEALRSSQCSVREELISIRQLHSSLPPEAVLLPSCVVVRRCGGCCQSDRLSCMPTSIYVTQLQVTTLTCVLSKICNWGFLGDWHENEGLIYHLLEGSL